MQKNRISKNNKGFTLLELVVTVVILALVTAPFLSSFVTASNTNVKSKRIQEANELSQYIIEQCKAANVSDVASAMSLSLTGDTYKGTLSSAGSNLPGGFSKNYKAYIELKPSAESINTDGIPEIESLNKKHCCVLSDVLNGFDDSAPTGSTNRVVNVTIDGDGISKYTVELKITYTDNLYNEKSSNTIKWEYLKSDIPTGGSLAVYLLWSSFAGLSESGDKINIENKVEENVNVYIIDQHIANKKTIETEKILFTDKNHTNLNMNDLYSSNQDLDYITVYTNVKKPTGDAEGAEGKNEIIKLNKDVSLYDINVKITYLNSDGTTENDISEYTAGKIEMLD